MSVSVLERQYRCHPNITLEIDIWPMHACAHTCLHTIHVQTHKLLKINFKIDEIRLEGYFTSLHMDIHDYSLVQVFIQVHFKGHKTTRADKELKPCDR